MSVSEWIQLGVGVVLFLTLLAVSWYAWETRAMRLEMQKQRLDSLRPIIDVVVGSLMSSGLIPEWLRLKGGKFGDKVPWEVSNIGVGPALEVEVSLSHPPLVFETNKVGTLARESQASFTLRESQAPFTLEEEYAPFSSPPPSGNSVVATYADVYGNKWKSQRDLSFVIKKGVIEYGPLTVTPLEGTHDS